MSSAYHILIVDDHAEIRDLLNAYFGDCDRLFRFIPIT